MPRPSLPTRALLASLALWSTLWSVFLAAPCHAAQALVIGTPCLTPNQTYPEFEAIVTEAYTRVGMDISFRPLPMVRDLKEANDGLIDGCLGRTPQALAAYRNLVGVPTPLALFTVVAFSPAPGMATATPKDLEDLRIGVVHGDVISGMVARDVGGRVVAYGGLAKALEVMDKGRLDAVVIQKTIGHLTADSLGLDVTASAPLRTTTMHHVLNDRNAHLAPKLDAALRAMLDDGTTARLLGRYRPMLPR